MTAVCIACGERKLEPISVCPHCEHKPKSREEKIASFALSDQCLKEHNLEKGSTYIKKTQRLPKFHDSVMRKAIQLVESYVEVEVEAGTDSDSFEMSSTFFDFDLSTDATEFVKVHAIGKPEHVAVDVHGQQSGKQSTYHTLEWEVGKDVTETDANLNRDISGDLYVWYRWFGQRWTAKFVSRAEFEQLRRVESQ